jgi:hypothetical protein
MQTRFMDLGFARVRESHEALASRTSGMCLRCRRFLPLTSKVGNQLLSCVNVDILVETYSSEPERHCVNFLKEVGYTCRIIKDAWWRSLIPQQRPREHNRWLFARPAGSHGLARRRRAR